MSLTVMTTSGTRIPLNDLEMNFTYDGDFVATITVEYADITYVQTFTNDGTNITNISQWEPQP